MPKNKTRDRVLITITILSFVYATGQHIFAYISEDADREISYATGSERHQILDFQESTPALGKLGLNLTQDSGWLVSEDIIVWNSGKYSLEPQDVRSELRIVLSPCKKILLVENKNSLATEISKFRFDIEKNSCKATLSWDVFDPGHGVHARFYFVSTTPKSGSVLLSGEIKELDRIARREIFRDRWKWEIYPLFFGTIVLAWLFVFGIMLFVSSVANFSDEDSDAKTTVSSLLFIFLSILLCLGAGMWLWELYIGHANIVDSMPFDLDQIP